MRIWTGAALAVSLIGCAYRPGSFEYVNHMFPGQRVTVGCLDVAVERRADMPVGPVLGFQFANRCNHVQPIDLGSVRVVARRADGRETPLVAYDPDRVIRRVWLDGRSANGEALAYGLDPDGRPAPPVVEVCVDLASMGASQAAVWRCFASRSAPPPALSLRAAAVIAPVPVAAPASVAASLSLSSVPVIAPVSVATSSPVSVATSSPVPVPATAPAPVAASSSLSSMPAISPAPVAATPVIAPVRVTAMPVIAPVRVTATPVIAPVPVSATPVIAPVRVTATRVIARAPVAAAPSSIPRVLRPGSSPVPAAATGGAP